MIHVGDLYIAELGYSTHIMKVRCTECAANTVLVG